MLWTGCAVRVNAFTCRDGRCRRGPLQYIGLPTPAQLLLTMKVKVMKWL